MSFSAPDLFAEIQEFVLGNSFITQCPGLLHRGHLVFFREIATHPSGARNNILI